MIREFYSFILARRLKRAGKISVAPDSFIRGCAHIEIGNDFYAGRALVLEAITEHNGIRFEPRIIIKNNVEIHDFVHIGATNHVEIGNNVLLASKIFISDHNHGIYSGRDQSPPGLPPAQRPINKDLAVIIEDNVWLGESVTVLPGVKIGTGSIIGANSVVTHDIPPFSIAAGNPARVIKQYQDKTKTWERV